MSNIQTHFGYVRREYFVKWDGALEWKVLFGSHPKEPDATGYCDSTSKTIFLSTDVLGMTEAGFRAFLIHEICHDVAAAGHTMKWAQRMEKAAKHADSIGEPEVAKVVRSEIFSYCGPEVFEKATGMTVRDAKLRD